MAESDHRADPHRRTRRDHATETAEDYVEAIADIVDEHGSCRVVDLARRDLAQRLLRETDYSLAEVAFLTGFAEQSGFTRAFKRWAGQTPRSYRLAAEKD